MYAVRWERTLLGGCPLLILFVQGFPLFPCWHTVRWESALPFGDPPPPSSGLGLSGVGAHSLSPYPCVPPGPLVHYWGVRALRRLDSTAHSVAVPPGFFATPEASRIPSPSPTPWDSWSTLEAISAPVVSLHSQVYAPRFSLPASVFPPCLDSPHGGTAFLPCRRPPRRICWRCSRWPALPPVVLPRRFIALPMAKPSACIRYPLAPPWSSIPLPSPLPTPPHSLCSTPCSRRRSLLGRSRGSTPCLRRCLPVNHGPVSRAPPTPLPPPPLGHPPPCL